MTNNYSTEKVNLAACLGIAFFGVAMLSLGAILPPLVKAVPEAIGLPKYMSVGIILGTVLFGPIMDRYGYKWLLTISAVIMMAGLICLAYSVDMKVLIAGIFCVGLGGGVLNGETNAIVSDIYDDTKRGRKMSVLGACYCIGAMLWTLACYFITDYKIPLFIFASLMLASVIYFIIIRFPKAKLAEVKEDKPTTKDYTKMFLSPALLLVAFTLFFQSGFEGTSGSYTTSYLTRAGNLAESSAILSLTWFTVGMMIGRFALSSFLKKMKDMAVLTVYMIIAAIGVGMIYFFSNSAATVWSAMALIGFGVGATYPVMLSHLGGVFRKMSGSAFSAAIFIALCGQFLGNFLVGKMFNSNSFLFFPIVLVAMIAAVLIIAPIATAACKRLNNKE
ncbi:MAG: MFS transporter [Bacteroidales bacterium]|nr:MFS transporter [Bacteroidales bacterium]